jgi:hypothetical protein
MALENGWPEKKDLVYAVHDAAFKAGRAAEREACAKVCDERASKVKHDVQWEVKNCAAAIRARGEK